jgi:hypothetical protein
LGRVISTIDGPKVVDQETYDMAVGIRRKQLTKMMTGRKPDAEDLENASREQTNSDTPIEGMELPPMNKESNYADIAMELVNLNNLMVKARVPHRLRQLYTRGIITAQKFNLPSLMDYIYTDIQLGVSEDGKSRKELLTPLENMLRDRTKQMENRTGPQI